MTPLYPLKLGPSFREKIWGSHDLSPVFEPSPKRIGEAWYTFEENTVINGSPPERTLGQWMTELGPRLMGSRRGTVAGRKRALGKRPAVSGAEQEKSQPETYFPILTKLLFTSQKLSVQVHPDDAYASAHEQGQDKQGYGKTEMWYVVDARPGAAVALGLTEELSSGDLREAARSGEIERVLHWVEAGKGQTFFVPAGTIHAIGEGLVIHEIQQNSDITYRLHDFGRGGGDGKPRTLHIDDAVRVARQYEHTGAAEPLRLHGSAAGRELLMACPYFAAERLVWSERFGYEPDAGRADILTFLRGRGRIGADSYRPGDCYVIPATAETFEIKPDVPSEAIRSYVPDLEKLRSELRAAGAGEERIGGLLHC